MMHPFQHSSSSCTFLLITLFLSFIAFSSFTTAALDTSAAEGITETVEKAKENLPTDPQQLREEYLAREWSKVIAQAPVIGSVHTYFLAHPLLFQILFAYPYEFSLTSFGIFILWLFFAIAAARIAAATALIPRGGNTFVGICFAVLLAQLAFINLIVTAALKLVLSNEYWWMRLLLYLLLFVLLVLTYYGGSLIAKFLKQRKAATEKAQLKQQAAESRAFMRGVKEGQELVKGIKK